MGKSAPITDDQCKVLETARDNPSKTPTEIARMLRDPALSAEYVNTVLNTYELKDDKGTPLSDLTITSEPAEPTEPTDDKPMSGTNAYYDPDTYDISTTALEGSYPSDHLGKKAKAYVWFVRENPKATKSTVSAALNTNRGTVRSYTRYYSHLIPEDASVWTGAEHPERSGINDLTEKQREVVKLTYEMTDSPVREIGEESSATPTNAQIVTKIFAHLLHPQFRRNNPQLLVPPDGVIENPHDHRTTEQLEAIYEEVDGHRPESVGDEEPPDALNDQYDADESAVVDDEITEEDVAEAAEETTESDPDAYEGSQVTQVDQRIAERLIEEADFHLETAGDGTRVDYAAGMIRVLEELEITS